MVNLTLTPTRVCLLAEPFPNGSNAQSLTGRSAPASGQPTLRPIVTNKGPLIPFCGQSTRPTSGAAEDGMARSSVKAG